MVGWYLVDSSIVTALPAALDDWDPQREIVVQVEVVADVEGCLSDCGLKPDASLRLALLWRSTESRMRGCGGWTDVAGSSEPQRTALTATIPGAQLAGRLELDLVLTLPTSSSEITPLVPDRAGAVLWRTTRAVVLEGAASRFPMEWADFASSRAFPEGAAWYLQWDPHDLTQSLAGTVRLYLNSSHPHLEPIFARTAAPEVERSVYEYLYFDIGRALIAGALADHEFVRVPESFTDDSVGATVRRLLNVSFPNDSIRTLADLLRLDPGRFDAQLQEHLQLFARFS